MNKPDELLDAPTVAERIGVHHFTVRNWYARGEFPPPAARVNGPQGYRWTEAQIAPWVALHAGLRELETQRLALIAQARAERLAAEVAAVR